MVFRSLWKPSSVSKVFVFSRICLDEAEYCDRVSIMVDGHIKALDTPRQLKQQFGVETMYDVFLRLAREAKRGDG